MQELFSLKTVLFVDSYCLFLMISFVLLKTLPGYSMTTVTGKNYYNIVNALTGSLHCPDYIENYLSSSAFII